MAAWQADGRLAAVTTAFSRTAKQIYVQDALREDSARIAQMIKDGAQVLVCGGRGMAEALTDILASRGLTPAVLKAKGRYDEDVY
jgi:sulfite reductase (NADPH) flavoprotein alpha-component